jgi:hypothetical protein
MSQWHQSQAEDVLRQLGSDATRGLSVVESEAIPLFFPKPL